MARLLTVLSVFVTTSLLCGQTKTWDGKYSTEKINVRVVYFVPSDRQPLEDWRERVDYYCKRIEQFHEREFQGLSQLKTDIHKEPFISSRTTEDLRRGDANAIFFKTLKETNDALEFGDNQGDEFPILLVLSEINWRPLDDFFRVRPDGEGEFVFEGNLNNGQHFPGAKSGGARATYLADRGVGWGLVSADGWRVPYRGTDCVVYHEGVGHAIGLPHPQPGDGSVMSLAQYRGWINESWVEKNQKSRLGWSPQEIEPSVQRHLFSQFLALPDIPVPEPDEVVQLKLTLPKDAKVKSLRVRYQTRLGSPWVEVPQQWNGNSPESATLATFDRATPVSYRVDVELSGGESAELWGYFQVREQPRRHPMPRQLSPDLITSSKSTPQAMPTRKWKSQHIDLLAKIDPDKDWTHGQKWKSTGKSLISPKQFGARLQMAYTPPDEYRITYLVEPLDEANGLILGQRSGDNRFLVLLNFRRNECLSALENVDGQNVGNETTLVEEILVKNGMTHVTVEVLKGGVTVSVDGNVVIDWHGKPSQLSLSDYWVTPDKEAIFIGAYDCRYEFHRITLQEPK